MNSVAKLVPLGVGLLVFAAVVVVMLQQNGGLGTWLLAAFLLGHGLVHVMFIAPQPPPATAGQGTGNIEYPFDAGKSWLVSAHVLDLKSVRPIVAVLVAVVVLGYGLAALATVGILVPASWWSLLVIVATLASAALMVVALSPGLVLGMAIDLVLLWLAIVAAWSPKLVVGG
jgi:hypothetical protein